MSVTHHSRYKLGRSHTRHARRQLGAHTFEELEVAIEHQGVLFKHTREGTNLQLIVLWCSAVLFMLYIVSIVPMMHLTAFGNALAVLVGLLVLATIGLIMQARVETTTIELSPRGVRVEQGTVLDRDVAEIDWKDLASVELEPVDPKDESKGVHLEIRPLVGDAVRTLPGVGVGDLQGVRQAILKAKRGSGPDEG